MLRFEVPEHRRPRNYLARREQTRLFALIVGMGAVILLIYQLSGGSDSPSPPAEGPVPQVVRSSPPVKSEELIVDRQRLASVKDNSHFRGEETDAWFYLFSLLDGTEYTVEGVPDVIYTQLVAQPHVYRGRLVRVRGEVERIEEVEPAKNDLGIEKLYRVILKPAGKSSWPITAYCLTLPAGWSVGEPPNNKVLVIGYFFKNLSYAWQNGMALTPVILCQSFSVREVAAPPTVAADRPMPVGKILGIALAIAIAFVALLVWRTTAWGAPVRHDDEASRVGDSLRQLSREGE
jgi:hypothetical protein